MRNLRLTPLRKGQAVLGQEQIDPATSLPTSTEDRQPLRLRPPSAPKSSMPVLASPEIDSGFDVDYSELDRPINPMRNIEDQLADTQSGFQMTMNALGRAGAEVGLGTLEGISYLADFEQMGNILQGEEEEYSNWFADFMKQGKEAVREAAPVYRTEEAQAGFAPFDSTWWASNAESIASTLSLMVPAAGAVRGLSMIGKAARAGLKGTQIATRAKNTSAAIKAANNLIYGKNASNVMKGASQAVISRYMENTMEASEVFKNSYEQLLAEGVPEEEARQRAGKGASQSWNTNWVNLGFDMMQYITLTKGMNAANFASKEFRKNAMGKAKDYLANMGQEAAEEGIQFVTGAEAERAAVEGKSYFELKGLGTRMADYLTDPEMQSAMFLGAVGGGVFEAFGGIANKVAGVDKSADAYLATVKSLDNGDIKTAHMVQGTKLAEQAFAYSQAGRLGDLKGFYQEMADATDEQLTQKGMSTEEIADKRKRDAEILSDIDYLGETYSTIFNDTTKTFDQKADELGLLFETRVQERTRGALENSYSELKTEALKTMSETQFTYKENVGRLARLTLYKKAVEKRLKGKPGLASLTEQLDNKIKQAQEAVNESKEKLKEEGNTEAIPISPVDSKLFGDPANPDAPGIIPQMDQLTVNQLEVQRILSTANTPEGQKERQEHVDAQKTQNALKQINHNAPYSVLQNVLNDNTLPDSAKKAVADQIEKMEKGGETVFTVPQENKEQEGMELRYKSSIMLGKDINALRQKGANVAGITTGNAFMNRYLKDSDFRKAANEHFKQLREQAEKTQVPDTSVPQPSNEQPSTADNTVNGNASTPSYTDNKYNEGVANEGDTHYVQTNEFVMTEYNDGYLRITGVEGINPKEKFSMEEGAAKIMEVLGVDAGNIPEGGLWVLKDNQGQPVRSNINTLKKDGEVVGELMSEEDFRILNDPNVDLFGKKLKMTLLLDYDFSPTFKFVGQQTPVNNMLVVVSTEVDGKEVRLGMLRTTKKGDNSAITQLRKNLYEQWAASGRTSGTFEFDTEVTINGRKNGSLNTVEQLNDPHTIVYENEEVYFGIVTVEDGKVVILDNNAFEKQEEYEDFVNQTYSRESGLIDHPGQAVQFIRSSSGTYIPTYLFAKALESNPEVMQEVREKVEAFYEAVKVKDGVMTARETIKSEFEKLQTELDARVSGRVVYDEINDTLTVKEVRNEQGEIVDMVGLDVDGVMDILSKRVMRLDLKKINTPGYNEMVSKQGRVKSNVSPSQHTFNSNIEMNLNDVTVTPQLTAAETFEALGLTVPQTQPTTTTKEGKPILQTRTDKKGRTIEVETATSVDGGITTTKYEAFRIDEKGRRKLTGSGYVTTVGELRSKLLEADSVDALEGLDDSAEVVILEESIGDTGSRVTFKVPGAADITTLTNNLIVTPFDATTAPTTEGTVEIPVNDMTIVYNPQTGEMTFKTTGGTPNETVSNKALVRYETTQGTLRRVTYNNTEYAILSDDRIISLSKTSAGKEVYKTGPQRNKILEQAGEVSAPVQTEASVTEETTTVPDVDPFDLDIDLDSDKTDDTRTREVNENIEYEEWDQEEELAWFKENYPDVPVEVLNDIREVVGNGGPDAWGLFRNASVYIQSNAAKGTAYHEAFHAVFNLMLTEKERKAILEAGESFAVGAINIEEYWADKFMEYQLAEGATAYTLPQKIADFFKRLWQMIRIAGERVGIGSASMNDYMYRVSKGLYAKKGMSKLGDVNFKRNITRYKVNNTAQNGMLNSSEKVFAKRFINGVVIDKILPIYRSKENLVNDNTLDDRETLRKIVSSKSKNPLMSLQGVYTVAYTQLNKELVEYKKDPEKNAVKISQLERTLQTMTINEEGTTDEGALIPRRKEDGTVVFRPFLGNLVTGLANYGIRYNVFSEDVNPTTFAETTELLEETEDVIENWMVKEKFMGPFEKFSQKASRIFSTIKSNESFAGFTIYENPSNVKGTLIYELSDSGSTDEMMENLRLLSLYKPQYEKLYDYLKDNNEVRSEFWINIGQRKNTEFILMYAKDDGSAAPSSSNKRNLKRDLVENFRYNFYNNSKYYNPEDNSVKEIPGLQEDVDVLAEIVKDVQGIVNNNRVRPNAENFSLTDDQIDAIYKITSKYKLDLSKERMKQVFTAKEGEILQPLKRFLEFAGTRATQGKGLTTFLNKLQSGKNPFFGEDLSGIKSIEKMMDVVMMADEQRYQPSPRNVNGDTIYTVLQSRFMFKLLNKFKSKNSKGFYNNTHIDEYMQDPFYENSPFLKAIEGDVNLRNELDIAVFDGLRYQGTRQAKEYQDLTPEELESVNINAYYNRQESGNEPAYGYFMMPVLADSTSAAFVKFKKYTKEEAILNIIETAKQERARINFIEKLKENGKEEFITDSMEQTGSKFQMFPFLNGKNFNDDAVLDKLVREWVESSIESEYQKMIDSGMIEEFAKGTKIKRGANNELIDKRILKGEDGKFNIQKYIANNMYMNMQLAITFAGDTAFYKPERINGDFTGQVDFTDFYKRVKEIWSPGDYLSVDDNNTYTDKSGKKIKVRENYNVSYIEDPTEITAIQSAHIDTIDKLFPNAKDAWIRKAYRELNNTDAATWIDIFRYREIMIGAGRWSDEKQAIYDDVMAGKKLSTKAAMVFQPIKPFNFSHRMVNTGVGKFMMPTQHKNAEMLLTPDMAMNNPKLEEMMGKMGYSFDKAADGKTIGWSFNEAKRITDSIMFTSAVKVGRYNVQNDISTISSDNTISMLNENYRIQQSTPEHHIDSENLFGSQIRKIIMNIDPTDTFTDPATGKEISGEEVIRNYQTAIAMNIKESYDELMKRFKNKDGSTNIEGLVQAMREQAIEMEYGDEIVEAFEWLDDNKTETVLPMWHPHIASRVEAMMYSYFKNKVTKQKINGISAYNTTSYGFLENNDKGLRKPDIVFDEREYIKDGVFYSEKEIKNMNLSSEDLKKYKNPNYGGIMHYEALLPAHMKGLEVYADEDGIIDINKVPEELKEGIFYRIPTEDYYSVFHIKVIGYLPSAVGGQIILPDEATTIAGLDFDIDKLFSMMYNTETSVDGELRKVPSGMDSKEARDNMIIDMGIAVLKNNKTTQAQLKPGNFESLKSMKEYLDILMGKEPQDLNPALLSTRKEIFERNMTGAKLIGTFANHNANHLLMIHGDFAFTKDEETKTDNSIKINMVNGRFLNNREFNGERITDNLAEFLAAAVDNAKDPLASFLNITDASADWIATMVRVGHSIPTAIAFMNLPPVRMITDMAKSSGLTGSAAINKAFSEVEVAHREALKKFVLEENPEFNDATPEERDALVSEAINKKINNYKKSEGGPGKILQFKINKQKPESVEDFSGSMAEMLQESYDMNDIDSLTEDQVLRRIVATNLLAKVKRNADALTTTQAAMRYDSSNNAAGPDVMTSLDLEEKFLEAMRIDGGTIEGFEAFVNSGVVPYVSDLYEYGIKAANETLSEVTGIPYARLDGFFAAFRNSVIGAKKGITVKEKNLINRMLITIMGSGYQTYNNKDLLTVMNELPDKISKYQEANPDSPFRLFLSRFAPISNKKTEGRIFIDFNRSGIDKIHQQEITDIWKSMLDSNNETEREIANDLVKYAYAQSGYTFGPNAFMDIVPTRYMAELHDNPDKSYTNHLKDNFVKMENDYSKLKEELAEAEAKAIEISKQLALVPQGSSRYEELNRELQAAESLVQKAKENIRRLFEGFADQTTRNLYERMDSVPKFYPMSKGRTTMMGINQEGKRQIGADSGSLYIKVVTAADELSGTEGKTYLMKKMFDADGTPLVDSVTRFPMYEEAEPLGVNNQYLEVDLNNALSSMNDNYEPLLSKVNKLKTVEVNNQHQTASTLDVVSAMPNLMAGAPEDVMLSLKNFDVNGKVDLSHPFVAFYKKMSAEEKANFKQGLVPLVEPMFQMPVDPAPVAQAKNVLKELVDMVETEQPTTLPEATQPTQQTGEVNFDKLREESKKKGVPIFELKDWSLKEPIQNGENTITHIIPNPTQGNFKVLFNRPTGQWMAKFSLKNGVVQKKLFKNEGTKSEPSMISSSKMSEDFMDESISAAIPADLITSITEDLKNVPPQTDTKLNTKDFAYTESIDKKYGIKKTLGDIAQPTTAPTQQTQSQTKQVTEAIDKKIMEKNDIPLSMFNELTEEEKEMMRNQERNCK
jgi:hypothetical protein